MPDLAALTAPGQLVTYVVVMAIYNTFHSLVSFPGPKLHAANQLTWSLDVTSGCRSSS